MAETHHGQFNDFVLRSDYDALAAEVERLRGACAAALNTIKHGGDGAVSVPLLERALALRPAGQGERSAQKPKGVLLAIHNKPTGGVAVDCVPNYAELGADEASMTARAMLAAIGIPDGNRNWKQTIDKRSGLRLAEPEAPR
jgi:hypothetical protein